MFNMMKSLLDNLKVTIQENKQPQQQQKNAYTGFRTSSNNFFFLKNKINLQH